MIYTCMSLLPREEKHLTMRFAGIPFFELIIYVLGGCFALFIFHWVVTMFISFKDSYIYYMHSHISCLLGARHFVLIFKRGGNFHLMH